MHRKNPKYFWYFLMVFISAAHLRPVYAQGCSDAGFCTVPTFTPETHRGRSEPLPNSIQLTLSYGRADHGIDVRSAALQYGRSFENGIGIDIQTTVVTLTDGLVESSGLSDLLATVTYRLSERMTGTAGIKIPFGKGNAESNNAPLPMDFQPSLGTLDAIAGISFSRDYGHIAVAIQQPLTHNENRFSAEQFSVASSFRTFQSTNGYRRGGDLLLRYSYPIALSEQWSITPGVLPIYHLTNDSFIDSAGVRRTIAGSRGLTVNMNLFAAYQPGSGHFVEIRTGFPIRTRTARPDGLTRSVVLTVNYSYRW